jgi:aryl-alcohol dehydrogenase-like predicted oxidoreductase
MFQSFDDININYVTIRNIIDRLHRRTSVTDEELHQLRRLIEELEERAHGSRDEPGRFDPDVATTLSGDMLSGHATRAGVERHAEHFGKESVAFYSAAQDLLVSSVGIGTHHGAMNDETDAAYIAAVHAALQAGVNLIDTSLNYRHQRSERSVAAGVQLFLERSGGNRDEVVVCTKGGYLVPGAITAGTLGADDVVGGSHCMAPAFLGDQIDRSRRNLGLETIDVYYIHNPETQLRFVEMAEFIDRIRAAFGRLERAVSDGLIRYYGAATWNGLRGGALSLRAIVGAARQVAGDNHHFRFLQLPLNLGMPEAVMRPVEGGGTVLDLAAELGITVIASGSLLQARLSRDLPAEITSMLPGLATDAQRAIQFTRSTPGIASALVGMRDTAHVSENLTVARIPPLTSAEHQRLCSTFF